MSVRAAALSRTVKIAKLPCCSPTTVSSTLMYVAMVTVSLSLSAKKWARV
jgi:hypothetical protein